MPAVASDGVGSEGGTMENPDNCESLPVETDQLGPEKVMEVLLVNYERIADISLQAAAFLAEEMRNRDEGKPALLSAEERLQLFLTVKGSLDTSVDVLEKLKENPPRKVRFADETEMFCFNPKEYPTGIEINEEELKDLPFTERYRKNNKLNPKVAKWQDESWKEEMKVIQIIQRLIDLNSRTLENRSHMIDSYIAKKRKKRSFSFFKSPFKASAKSPKKKQTNSSSGLFGRLINREK